MPQVTTETYTAGELVATGQTVSVPLLHKDWRDAREYGVAANGATDDTAALTAAVADMPSGSVLVLPVGTIVVSGSLGSLSRNGVTIAGRGREATIVRLAGNLASPLLTIEGPDSATHRKWVTLRDFTVFNPTRTYTGDLFHAKFLDRLTIRDVAAVAVNGTVLYGEELWDSRFDTVQVENCGGTNKPCIDLQAADSLDSDTGCNNLVFTDVQVEAYRAVGMRWGEHTRKCRWVGGKFHGVLPTPEAHDAVQLDGAYANQILGTNFTVGGADHVSLANGSNANLISGTFDSAAGAGVRIAGSNDNRVDATFAEGGANGSDYTVESGTGNVVNGTAV